MGKALLLSIIVSFIAIPVAASRERNAMVGLRKALKQQVFFNLFYLFVLMFLYGRF